MAQRVVVFGAAGIGGAIARRLHRAGSHVHVIARTPAHTQALAQEGIKVSTWDAMNVDGIESFAKEVFAEPMHGLVYAVGSIPLKPLKSTTAKDFHDAFVLNTLAPALLLKGAAASLAAGAHGPGSAVFFSSIAASTGFPNHTAIAAAKAGLEGFVRSAAAELTPKVRVNGIALSLTDTPLAKRLTSNDTVKKALGEAHPLGKLGTPEDAAALACFLLDSAQSGWMTGEKPHDTREFVANPACTLAVHC